MSLQQCLHVKRDTLSGCLGRRRTHGCLFVHSVRSWNIGIWITIMLSSFCGVFGCTHNTKTMPHLSFFSLPKDDARRKRWLELMDRNDIIKLKNPRHLVCSSHFTKDKFKNKRLKPDAVPSVNLPGSKVISCGSTSKENVETQVDKPVIVEMVQPEQETYVEVDLLDIKEEKIEKLPQDEMETDASNEDAMTQTSSRIASTQVFQEPLPIKLEIFDETERDNSAVPFTTIIPTGTDVVREPLRVKLEVFDETETDRSDSSAVPFPTSVPSGSNSTTNKPDSQVTNPLPAIPGIPGQAEEVELWTLDEYDKFGLSIAKSMKNMSDVDQRIKLIAAIENLVAEYVTKDVKKTFPNTSFASEATQSSKSFDPAYATFAFQNKDNSYTLVCTRKSKSQNK